MNCGESNDAPSRRHSFGMSGRLEGQEGTSRDATGDTDGDNTVIALNATDQNLGYDVIGRCGST